MFYSNVDCFTVEKKLELQSLLTKNGIDIIGLTEILPKHSVFENLEVYYKLDNYNIFTSDLKEGRGVVICVREGLCAEQVILRSDFKEAVWCKIKLRQNDTFLVGCLYRSPNSSDQNSLELMELFKTVKDTRDSHKLIMGDFNLREINWGSMTTTVGENHTASLFVECVRDSYFFQHVIQPTRVRSGNEPSLLDLIFTNEEDMISGMSYLPSIGKSDHLLISFSYNCYTATEFETGNQVKYNYHKGNYQSVKADMAIVDWDEELRGLDLSRSWSRLTEIYIKLVQEHIPESGSRRNREGCIPYLTQSCFDAIRAKHQKWLKFKYCNTVKNFNRYKQARNTVTTELRKAKYNYEKDLSAKIKTDNKIFWSYVRKQSKTKSVVSKLLMSNGEVSTTPPGDGKYPK